MNGYSGSILATAACATLFATDVCAGRANRTINLTRAAEACMHAKNPDERIAGCSDTIEISRSYQEYEQLAHSLHNRAAAYASKGEFDRAIVDCTEAIRVWRYFAPVHRLRGLLYMRQGDLDRAIADFDEALRIRPGYAMASSDRAAAVACHEARTQQPAGARVACGLNGLDGTSGDAGEGEGAK